MTTELEPGEQRNFARATMPWLVAAAALLLYLLTLNHWLSFNNLAHVAKLSGWTWQVELSAPLYLLVTYPLRFLPAQHIPLALNLFSCVCAALVLALLARSVALLPHDRTVAQRERERDEFGLLSIRTAWVAPLLAVVVCALQITFWENATAGGSVPPWIISGPMFDLLLFAYVVRCVLEYRIDEQESWLTRASLVMGMAMTNDWAMIGYFPLFVGALVWIMGMKFFNPQFLVRMFVWGTVGLLLYFLLPIVQAFFGAARMPFWTGFSTNLGTQRFILEELWGQRQILAVLSFTSILPVILMGIRWSSYFGDTSRTGTVLARVVFHIVHGFLLIACIWIALDPPVSPRNQHVGAFRGSSIPFLSFYYLGSIAIGYLTGYFLLVFGPRRPSRHARPVPPFVQLIDRVVSVAVWVLVVLTPVALLVLNLPRIRMANGPFLRQYASLMAGSLPPEPSVVLSDDPVRLGILRAALAGTSREKDYVFADTASLRVPDAQAFLHREYPNRWPVNLSLDRSKPVDDMSLLELVAALGKTNRLIYLHPSFGYYFEAFYPEPKGLLQNLAFYAPGDLLPPKLSPEALATNQQFWAEAGQLVIEPLSTALSFGKPTQKPSFVDGIMQSIHLKLEPHPDVIALGKFYSRSLNNWGAQLQRHDLFDEAGKVFALAQQMNPENVVARINSEYSERRRGGVLTPIPIGKNIEEQFGKYRTWEDVLRENGPYDEPGFCYSQGMQFLQGKNYRQAGDQFHRAFSLYPGHVAAGLELAGMHIMGNKSDEALAVIDRMRQSSDPLVQNTNKQAIAVVEGSAYLVGKNPAKADACFARLLTGKPGDTNAVDTAVNLFLRYKFFDESLKWIDMRLKLTPEDASALVNKGYAHIQAKQYAEAIPPLTLATALATNNIELLDSALFNRAIAELQLDNLDAAAADYAQLLGRYDNAPQIHYGLGEIAYRKHDTNGAISSYERYLALAPASTDEAKAVQARLSELKPGGN